MKGLTLYHLKSHLQVRTPSPSPFLPLHRHLLFPPPSALSQVLFLPRRLCSTDCGVSVLSFLRRSTGWESRSRRRLPPAIPKVVILPLVLRGHLVEHLGP